MAQASRMAAVSRTVWLTTCWHEKDHSSRGPWEILPRDGFRPTRPHMAAGMRIEPPPSLAWAAGTMPVATAAAAPPDDPPVLYPVFHGFRHGPVDVGSVVATRPSSGVLVRPTITNPASLYRVTRLASSSAVKSASLRAWTPPWWGCPASVAHRSLMSMGTPRNGPSGRSGEAARTSAWSNWR